jgi:hypothetical protein
MVCAPQHILLSNSGRWDGHVGRMGAMTKAQKVLTDKPQLGDNLEYIGEDAKQVTFTLEQAMKPQTGSTCILPLFL